ncbi:MAG TPA: 30S ribosomal protein S12 methylthiotransferase RimO [Planctomycetaceae bacterium]|nr:30S ribosomal protein S12 methylthiotransferase RimO [Planctomycetaceae bacterium]
MLKTLPIVDAATSTACGVAAPLAVPIGGDPASRRGTFALVSLGCPKNLVDSERMLGLLRDDGWQFVAEPRGADLVIVNTCAFLEASRQESYGVIDEMLALKRSGATRGVIVAGCLAERQKEALLAERPGIDAAIGVFSRDEVARAAERLIGGLGEQRGVFRPAPARALDDSGRMRVTPRHVAYLKISEGCDRTCTFCSIPRMRGRHASKPMTEVVREARELAADGVRELVIVAQDTTYYGIDIDGEPRLVELLGELERIDGIEWIRLMYLYPIHFTERLVATIAGSDRIVPYLDLPLQHASDQVLKRMQRRVNRAATEELLGTLRESIPDLVLRTTFITGFPGETRGQFEELLDFVRRWRFERLGVFAYSLEHDTPAARLDGHLPEDERMARRDELMAVQQGIAHEHARRQVGRTLDVIIDGPSGERDDVWLGRSKADAPDIDCTVYVTAPGTGPGRSLTGRIVPVEIVAAAGYDLAGIVAS